MGDLNPVLERIVALRTSIIDDGIANGVPFHPKDRQTLLERVKSEGSSFVEVTLPILGRAFDQALISGTFICPAGFRLGRNSRLPSFLGNPIGLVFQSDGVIRSQPSLVCIFFIRQFLLLDSKLIKEPTALQKEDAQNGFIDRQVFLRQRKVPVDNPILLRAQRLLTDALQYLDLSTIDPGHGPGATAEHLDRAERWTFPSWPLRAERYYPYSEYAVPSFVALCSVTPPKMVADSVTRCCLVPKDSRGPRLISAESAATQYLQQGQMRALMTYIDNHPLMSLSIRLRDQTHNQKMCERAYERGYATLDLSNASDNVSATLVWYLLKGVPKLRRLLFCTRSQSIRIGKHKYRLASFAPMGSAVCFPVETLVFWSLAMASTRHVHAATKHDSQKSAHGYGLMDTASDIAVFGDDIIIPEYALSTLTGILTEVGCEINRSKTCYITPFRESCGSEWYSSTDVSITRNKRYYYDATKRIANYPVLLDLQRKFFLQGLVRTAALCESWAREIGPLVTLGFRDVRISHCGLNSTSRLPESFRYLREGSSRMVLDSTGPRTGSREQAHTGSATALPSGLDFYVRNSASFYGLHACLGWHSSLDSGLSTRYRADLQRTECRLPTVFQCCRQWDHRDPVNHRGSSQNPTVSDGRNRDLKEDAVFRLKTGYPRLMARLLGDYIERIAIRGYFKPIMAWSEIPFTLGFHPL